MIDILMATYNGEKYIKNQIESILNQHLLHFSMIIRDDGSRDNTVAIVSYYEKANKDRIKIIQDNLGNLGSSRCFMELLKYSEADYIMFSDQDDIWLPNKIELTFKKLLELEGLYGKGTPILVFTDLRVVNKDLKIISESYWKYQKLNPYISKNWKMLLANNVITGCTIMINRKAKEVVLPFKLPEMLYDHWVGVNISQHGVVDFLNTQTLLYKQHEGNVVGGHRFNLLYIIKKFAHVTKFMKIMIVYYDISKYFNVAFLEFIFLKIKIIFMRLTK